MLLLTYTVRVIAWSIIGTLQLLAWYVEETPLNFNPPFSPPPLPPPKKQTKQSNNN